MLSAAGRLLTRSFRRSPVFVVGVGRSGTSVVHDALGAHPEIISAVTESPFIGEIGSAASSFETGETATYRVDALRTSLEYMHDSLRRLAFESAMGAHYGLRSVAREVIKRRKVPFALRRWCTKTFPGSQTAGGLATLYPDVRFLYVVRNGCDVVRSRTRFQALRERSFEEHCREWAESVERYAYLLTDDRAITVRHEVLTADPVGTFDAILSFIGVSPDPAPGAFAATTHVLPLDEPTQVEVVVRERLRERAPAYEGWTGPQRETFKSLCGKAMLSLGYEVPF